MNVVLRCRRGHVVFLASSEHRVHPMSVAAACAKCRRDKFVARKNMEGAEHAGAGGSAMGYR